MGFGRISKAVKFLQRSNQIFGLLLGVSRKRKDNLE